MQRIWLAVGAVNGFLAVACGAFGAHALKTLPEPWLGDFKTGAQYQMVHALALLAVAATPRSRWTGVAGWCFTAGIFVFSGSLYVLALTQVRWLGAITPLGGVALLTGWMALAGAALRGRAPAR